MNESIIIPLKEMKIRKFTIVLLVLTSFTWMRVSAQQWVVPDDKKGVIAPFKFVPDSIKKGEVIFMKNCTSCHGIVGKKNWAKITPEPGDPASDKFQKQTDGELFFRITTGKVPMPEFRNILPENDRWNVIAYFRSFNPAYKQPNPAGAVVFNGRVITLAMDFDKSQNKVRVLAKETLKDKSEIPAEGVHIILNVKRYFGSMQIDEARNTNKQGVAMFTVPADLPGDKEGYLDLTARVDDKSGQTSDASANSRLAIGKPTDVPSLLRTRAWWSTRDRAPIWLILTYSLAVLVVWGLIFYILFMVNKLRRI